jgi:hypothetical protein
MDTLDSTGARSTPGRTNDWLALHSMISAGKNPPWNPVLFGGA